MKPDWKWFLIGAVSAVLVQRYVVPRVSSAGMK
jgi:hypothetical protein